MYQVLARKCRPQVFEELVGQGHVTRTLANAIAGERLAHAYIFAGLRGSGKTTVARILAKCLNCETGPTATPCGRCVPCREIAESRAIDVLELDAATRTQVDNIRELQEVIAYAPARDRYKVLIIDEAHMLSKNAANALLKTLEEPPPRVVFVLATTEIQKILPTIVSRCQVFEFRRVAHGELTDYLRWICAGERIEIDDRALERIARAGEGSVRDSLSVLERALAFSGGTIGDDDVMRMLGGVRFEVVRDLVAGLAARDTSAMLDILDALVDEGHDLLHFWSEVIGALRDLLLLQAAPSRLAALDRPADEAKRLTEAAAGLSTEDLTRAFQILADLEPVLKTSSQPRFMFEAALIRLASLGAVRPIEQVLAEIRTGTATAEPTAAASRPAAARPPAQKKNEAESVTARPGEDRTGRFVAAVFGARPMLGSILERAQAIRVIGDALAIRLAAGAGSLARQLERKENLEVLVEHSSRLFGRTLRIVIESDDEAATVDSARAASAGSAAAVERPPTGRRSKGGGKRGSLVEVARSEPGVSKLLRDFGAQVVDIRPLPPSDGTDRES
ncbi:MAG TPA: DNA polymerase III subunit gamma/tau [Candidatus Polarisedimenticolaceae bacterium]|nr:DNA polymerase III subunit gamma/tau [Candidatus Polarisedimenticolaceae bacterium]